MTENNQQIGKIAQVTGAVVDVRFAQGEDLPPIHTALTTTNTAINDSPDNLTLEIAQHLGDNIVRCIAMDSTDGLVRGQEVKSTGAPISIPVGEKTLGRIIDVIGRPVDEMGPIETDVRWSIHRPTPSLEEQATSKEILETGLKVVDFCSAVPV